MERKENRKEGEDREQAKGTVSENQNEPNSSMKPSDGKRADDDGDVVKDENIPVTYINTAPEDIPTKHQ